jgi:hypothetical protein
VVEADIFTGNAGVCSFFDSCLTIIYLFQEIQRNCFQTKDGIMDHGLGRPKMAVRVFGNHAADNCQAAASLQVCSTAGKYTVPVETREPEAASVTFTVFDFPIRNRCWKSNKQIFLGISNPGPTKFPTFSHSDSSGPYRTTASSVDSRTQSSECPEGPSSSTASGSGSLCFTRGESGFSDLWDKHQLELAPGPQ